MSYIPGGPSSSFANRKVTGENEVIKSHHKFLWNEDEKIPNTVESKLAKSYHDQLFKEYCIGDLTHYKTSQIALRWRTKNEVISGKGEVICANKKCNSTEDLKSWEVNFKYVEHGKTLNALVKLRLCQECSIKLNYHKKHNLCKIKSKKDSKQILKTETTEISQEEPSKNSDSKELEDNLWNDSVPLNTEMSVDQKIESYLSSLM